MNRNFDLSIDQLNLRYHSLITEMAIIETQDDPEAQDSTKEAISWFKTAQNLLTSAVTQLIRKPNLDAIVDQVNTAADQWGDENPEWASFLSDLAQKDANQVDLDSYIQEDISSFIASTGQNILMAGFKIIKFVIFDVFIVLLRTIGNTMKSVFGTGHFGFLKAAVAFIFPIISIFGSGSGGFLVAAGVYYLNQVLKSIGEHTRGESVFPEHN
jgi:hypothetical protein